MTPGGPAGLRSLGRALPRTAGAALGLVLLRSDRGALVALGGAVLVLSLMTNPARWWRYVRTGSKADPRASSRAPGEFRVELTDPGPRPVEVVKALRKTTGVDLPGARAQVAGAPVTVTEGVSADTAREVAARLRLAGGAASVLGHDG